MCADNEEFQCVRCGHVMAARGWFTEYEYGSIPWGAPLFDCCPKCGCEAVGTILGETADQTLHCVSRNGIFTTHLDGEEEKK